ncbi:hypothetical protein IHE33_08380 [Mycetohabitans endofungorum]|uniref:hypothetical protein n=1 Tax=Mycetohabitans endofungorum TaxID=417203 RepID=UPI0030D55218
MLGQGLAIGQLVESLCTLVRLAALEPRQVGARGPELGDQLVTVGRHGAPRAIRLATQLHRLRLFLGLGSRQRIALYVLGSTFTVYLDVSPGIDYLPPQ